MAKLSKKISPEELKNSDRIFKSATPKYMFTPEGRAKTETTKGETENRKLRCEGGGVLGMRTIHSE